MLLLVAAIVVAVSCVGAVELSASCSWQATLNAGCWQQLVAGTAVAKEHAGEIARAGELMESEGALLAR